MYLFQKIEEAAFKQNDARRTIGDFLLSNREKVSEYSMEEIAKLTHTSKRRWSVLQNILAFLVGKNLYMPSCTSWLILMMGQQQSM